MNHDPVVPHGSALGLTPREQDFVVPHGSALGLAPREQDFVVPHGSALGSAVSNRHHRQNPIFTSAQNIETALIA